MKKQVLIKNENIEIRKSPIHGYGVFANKDINAGETLEECHYISVSKTRIIPEIKDYVFGMNHNNKSYVVIIFGYGSIYNSAMKKNDENAIVKAFPESEYISFYAKKDIKAGDEIFIYYGDNWRLKDRIGL